LQIHMNLDTIIYRQQGAADLVGGEGEAEVEEWGIRWEG
jgi:hypothetical protein